MVSHFKTFIYFALFCLACPFLLVSYSGTSSWTKKDPNSPFKYLYPSIVAVSLTNYVWLSVLTLKYPNLDFVRSQTVRSVLDTKRNQGYAHVLVQLHGECDLAAAKEKLHRYVLDRKDRLDAEWRYPKLRQTLTTCCGYYAWIRDRHK